MHPEDTSIEANGPIPAEAPKVAPEDLTLRAAPRPVMRLHRRTLVCLAGGLSAAVLGAMLWSLQPPLPRSRHDAAERYNVDRVATADALNQLPADYAKLPPKVPVLGPPLPGDLGPAMVHASPAVASDIASGADAVAAERDARRKEAEAAAGSSVFFRSGQLHPAAVSTASAPSEPSNGIAGFDPQGAGPASMAPQPVDSSAASHRRDPNTAFPSTGMTSTPRSSDVQEPASPYQVMAGTVIAAALVTGIRSDLPGDVIGTVTEPVYDSATGRYLLIPQGSRLLGKYNSQSTAGQRRVQVVWQRLILPDTSSLTLDNLAGTDPAGYAGLEDSVDVHWARLIAGAALTTLLGVGAELAAPENRQHGDRVILAGRNSLQDSVNQAGQAMTRRHVDLKPTLTERPGLPVRIIVNRDLVLRPYQPLFFNQGTSR